MDKQIVTFRAQSHPVECCSFPWGRGTLVPYPVLVTCSKISTQICVGEILNRGDQCKVAQLQRRDRIQQQPLLPSPPPPDLDPPTSPPSTQFFPLPPALLKILPEIWWKCLPSGACCLIPPKAEDQHFCNNHCQSNAAALA